MMVCGVLLIVLLILRMLRMVECRYARMGARLSERGRVRGAAATQHCRQCSTLLLQINRLTNIGHIPQVTIIRSPLITSNDDTVQVVQLM